MGGEPLLAALWVSCGLGYVASVLLCFRPRHRPASLSTLAVATLAGLLSVLVAPDARGLAYFALGAGAAFPLCALHNHLRTLIRRRLMPSNYGRDARVTTSVDLISPPDGRDP